MRRLALSHHLVALSAISGLLLPGAVLAEQDPAAEPAQAPVAPQSSTEEYSSTISEVDACNQAQNRAPENATITAMHVSTKVNGEYATFTCRAKWSLSPAARPTDRPILFSPSA